MQPPENQPLLPHHETEHKMTARPLLPLPLLLALILSPFFLLPHIFSRSATSTTKHSNNQHLKTAARKDTINLLSLNTFIRPRLIGFEDYKDERLQDLLEPLLQRDLLCLQELFWTTGNRKQKFLDELSKHLPYAAHSPNTGLGAWFRFPPKPIDAGLAILSTRRITDTRYHMYSNSAWNSVDWFVSKGILYAGVEVLTGVVHVFTTHMQAGDFEDVRKGQIRELIDFVNSIVGDNEVIIIAGDLNVDGRRGYDDSADSEAYSEMMDAMKKIGVVDVMKEHIGQVVTTAGGLWGVTQKNERIDYLLLRKGAGGIVANVADDGVRVQKLRVRGKNYRTMSDHYAVVAEILIGLG